MADVALVDARWHCVGHRSGRLWIEQVLRYLPTFAPGGLTLKVVVREGHAACVGWNPSDVEELPATLHGQAWAHALGSLARELGADILLTHYLTVPVEGLRQIVVVHDVIHEDYPEMYTPEQLNNFAALRRDLHKAAEVITVSEYTRSRLLAHDYVRSSQLITVIPNGVSHTAVDLPCVHNHHAPHRYVIFIGRLTDRKNLHVLLAAMDEKAWPVGMRTVVCGEFDGVSDRARSAVAQLVATGRGRHFVNLPDQCVYTLLQRATALTYIPTVEGFGLPVAEGAALGVDVITTGIPVAVEYALPRVEVLESLSARALADAVARAARRRIDEDAALRGSRVSIMRELHWRGCAAGVAGAMARAMRSLN